MSRGWTAQHVAEYEARNARTNKAGSVPSSAKPEPPVHDESMAAEKGNDAHPIRRVVRITSFRLRLLDERNLADKYFTDALIYAGILHGDSPDEAQIIVRQEKVSEAALERTEIWIE